MSDLQDLSQQIAAVCRRLHERNLLAAADGNVSVRLDDGRILITPGGRYKADLDPQDMALVDLDDRILQGRPSSERLLHLAIYRACPDAAAVVHAHPPTTTAWSIARPELRELPCRQLAEAILATGRVPIAPYARTGTPAMAEVVQSFLPQHRIIMLARHGAVAWGESLAEAYAGIERLEHIALILWQAQCLAGPGQPLSELPEDEVDALLEKRKGMPQKIL